MGFLLGLAIALLSANSGIKSLFEGMNVAYGEAETRSFVKAECSIPGLHYGRHFSRCVSARVSGHSSSNARSS